MLGGGGRGVERCLDSEALDVNCRVYNRLEDDYVDDYCSELKRI